MDPAISPCPRGCDIAERLRAGRRQVVLAEDGEELVPQGLRLGPLAGFAPPVRAEPDRALANLLEDESHRSVVPRRLDVWMTFIGPCPRGNTRDATFKSQWRGGRLASAGELPSLESGENAQAEVRN